VTGWLSRRARVLLCASVVAVFLGAGANGLALVPHAYTQQGSKLTVSGSEDFGQRVAISADGSTALVAEASEADTQTAYVFVRTASGWTQQATLTFDQGYTSTALWAPSLALSADGNTAMLGVEQAAGPGSSSDRGYGAAWVYTRSGSSWSSGQEIQPDDEAVGNCTGEECSYFGASVAVSGNGTEALIGGFADSDGNGAAWVYTESGGSWSEAVKIVPTGSANEYGEHVAMSSNGTTALISGAGPSALVYTGSGSTWSLQQALAYPADSYSGGQVERTSTLSGSGGTALLGDGSAFNSSNADGTVSVFDRASSGTWSQTATLSNPSNVNCANQVCDAFGVGLALSDDGNTALIGAPLASLGTGTQGAAWVFTRTSSSASWSQSPTLSPSDANGMGDFGDAVALSGDATTAVIGGPDDNNNQGAAWVFSSGSPGLVVNSTGNAAAVNPSSGVCDTGNVIASGAPECTLWAAIQVADAAGGGMITFDLPAGSGPILAPGGLPALTAPITIDGTGSSPVIEGSGASGVAGFTLSGSGEKLSNLTVNGFPTEIQVEGTGGDELDHLNVGPGPPPADAGSGCIYNNPLVPAAAAINVTSASNQIGPAVDVADVNGCDLVLAAGSNGDTVGGIALGMTFPDGGTYLNSFPYPTGDMVISGSSDVLTGNLGTPGMNFGAVTDLPNLVGRLFVPGDYDQVVDTQAGGASMTGSHDTLGSTGSGNTFGSSVSCTDDPGVASTLNSSVSLYDGSSDAVEGDTILGGCGAGIWVDNGGDMQIAGNGITASGTAGYPGSGAIVLGDSSDDTISGNTIERNNSTGIAILSGDDDTISDNSMYADKGLGIDLGATGAPMEIDRISATGLLGTSGPNHLLSYPTILSATTSGGNLHLIGGLEGVPGGQSYTIEVFSNSGCGAYGYGEGQTVIGSFQASTFGAGRITGEADFDVTIPAHGLPSTEVTATATDSQGDTSEFSKCGIANPGPAAANLTVGAAVRAAGATGIAGIANGHGLTVTGAAGAAGTVSVAATSTGSADASDLAGPARSRTVTVLSGRARIRSAGSFQLELKLTAKGHALLRHAEHVTLTFAVAYTARDHRYGARQAVTVSRKG
jgi:parallel beta-helix repeat protein